MGVCPLSADLLASQGAEDMGHIGRRGTVMGPERDRQGGGLSRLAIFTHTT